MDRQLTRENADTTALEALWAAPTAHSALAILAPDPPPPPATTDRRVTYDEVIAAGVEASRASLWAAVLAQRSVRLSAWAEELRLQMQAEAVSPWTGRLS